MTLPTNLLYTKDHEWVLLTGSTARIGITDYAQDALGDIVFIQLPLVDSEVKAHDAFSEIESTKSVNDVYSPVSGTVARVNQNLIQNPELLNSDPFGEGWICEISVDGDVTHELLSPDQYQSLIE